MQSLGNRTRLTSLAASPSFPPRLYARSPSETVPVAHISNGASRSISLQRSICSKIVIASRGCLAMVGEACWVEARKPGGAPSCASEGV